MGKKARKGPSSWEALEEGRGEDSLVREDSSRCSHLGVLGTQEERLSFETKNNVSSFRKIFSDLWL